jgi:hypothetical protein
MVRSESVSASPTLPDSPRIDASQAAGALSSGEGEAEAEGNRTDEDEGEDENDTYSEGDDRGGDRVVHFSSLIPRILWKSTGQTSNILSPSTLPHVSVGRFTSTMI